MILSLFTKCNVSLINTFDLKMSSIISIMDEKCWKDMLKIIDKWKFNSTRPPNSIYSNLLNSQYVKILKSIPVVKNGNDIGILIDSSKILYSSFNTELKGENLIRIIVKLKKCMILSKGIWPLIPSDKRPNVFNGFWILKTQKKILVSFITMSRKTWIKKPISQVNLSTKILKGFTFTMTSHFFCQVPVTSNTWQIRGKNNKGVIWMITTFLSLLFRWPWCFSQRKFELSSQTGIGSFVVL